jgi:hypothetical protein
VLSEKQHINYFMVFGLNRSGLEHTIYHTRGERANHYTKDAVDIKGEGTQSNNAFFSQNGIGWS